MTQRKSHSLAFVALLIGNFALAAGPFLVRNSGVGPVAAGFWRLALALPFLWAIAWMFRQPVHLPKKAPTIAIALAALFLVAWLLQAARMARGAALPPALYVRLLNAGALRATRTGDLA